MSGEMGAGKTTFTRALAEGLGVTRAGRVRSPTYAVCMRHAGPIELVHLDLFRLGERSTTEGGITDVGPAFASLGLAQPDGDGTDDDPRALWGPGRVLVVEWSELWTEPPPDHLRLDFRRIEDLDGVRRVQVSAAGRRSEALATRWWGHLEKGP